MRAVLVHLDAGLWLGLAVGVAAEVVAPLEHQDLEVELGRAAFGDRQPEEPGADDDEIRHRALRRHDRSVYGRPCADPIRRA